jgi:hypothetical protein
MAICFVIQPFDSGKFDKRYEDIYRPAIEAAGLEAYRVDKDPGVSIPIESIEKGICQAAVCLADITADNPNVWYELGYAFASGRPVIMVCSEERTGKKYPFDIQHRSIIPYMADAPSDFDRLRENLTKKLTATIERGEVLEQIADSNPVIPIKGLSQTEILVLAIIAGAIPTPTSGIGIYSAKRDAERAGITTMGFNIALRRLTTKKFIEMGDIYDEQNNEPYKGVSISNAGWEWIEENESQFVLHRGEKKGGRQ